VANNLNDVLIPQFKKTFTLNDWQSGLVQSAFYMGYFVLALPAAMVMRRFGYKSAVVLGLAAVRRGRAAVLSGRPGARIFLVPGRPVRDRQRPGLPGDLGQSADDGAGRPGQAPSSA
jgi:MFS family permease